LQFCKHFHWVTMILAVICQLYDIWGKEVIPAPAPPLTTFAALCFSQRHFYLTPRRAVTYWGLSTHCARVPYRFILRPSPLWGRCTCYHHLTDKEDEAHRG
jgi:hypothetical protein